MLDGDLGALKCPNQDLLMALWNGLLLWKKYSISSKSTNAVSWLTPLELRMLCPSQIAYLSASGVIFVYWPHGSVVAKAVWNIFTAKHLITESNP